MDRKNEVLNEEHRRKLNSILRRDENLLCADCRAKSPRWASVNLGIFICMRCCGIHRSLGTHLSQVRSVALDTWTPKQVEFIQSVGNAKANGFFERNLPSSYPRPSEHSDDATCARFIRNKYEKRLWVMKEGQGSKRNGRGEDQLRKQSRPQDAAAKVEARGRQAQARPRPPEKRMRPSSSDPSTAKPVIGGGPSKGRSHSAATHLSRVQVQKEDDFLLPTEDNEDMLYNPSIAPAMNQGFGGPVLGDNSAAIAAGIANIQPFISQGNQINQNRSLHGHYSPGGSPYNETLDTGSVLRGSSHALGWRSAPVSGSVSPVMEKQAENAQKESEAIIDVFSERKDHNSTKNSILALFNEPTSFQNQQRSAGDQFLGALGGNQQGNAWRGGEGNISRIVSSPSKQDPNLMFNELRL